MERKYKFFFDHLPKTGGTTVYQVLKASLGDAAVTNQLSLPHSELVSRYAWKTLISAHTRFQPGDEFDPGRYYFTVLREPLDRALSHYWFRRGFSFDPGWRDVQVAKSRSFSQLVHSDDPEAMALVANVQAHHYASMLLKYEALLDDERLFQAAKEAMDRYDLVGVNEDLGDMLLVLGADCGIRIGNDIPRLNRTRARSHADALSAEDRRQFARLNEVDLELYEYARNRFRAHRRRVLAAEARMPDCDAEMAGPRRYGAQPRVASPVAAAETGGQEGRIEAVSIRGQLSGTTSLYSGELATILVRYSASDDVAGASLSVALHDDGGQLCFGTSTTMRGRTIPLLAGSHYCAAFTIAADLAPGTYFISAALLDAQGKELHSRRFVTSFLVTYSAGYPFGGLMNLNPTLRITSNGTRSAGDDDGAGGVIERQRRLGIATPPLSEFSAAVRILSVPASVMLGELFTLEAELVNNSSQPWFSQGARPVQIGCRWSQPGGVGMESDSLRTRLPRDVGPGETLRASVHARSPAQSGHHVLRVCLIQEYVAWFDDHRTGFADVDVVVR
ncbi:MAG: Wzt carbohydrate-binding domain-containing protein [Pseudomonadota bacterium]